MFYYGINLVDAVVGDIAPLFVLSLIERLPEGSKTYALMRSREHWRAYLDIAPEYYGIAAIVNAVNCNTGARGNFKKKPKFEPFPTPDLIVEKLDKRKSTDVLAKLHRKFMGG